MTALVYTIFAAVTILAFVIGITGGYFFFNARHNEAVAEIEAFEQELNDRESELRRLKYQISNLKADSPSISSAGHPDPQLEVQRLRDELEHRDLDLNILQQDFELETGLLKQEIAQIKEQHVANLQESQQKIDSLAEQLRSQEAELASSRQTLKQEKQILSEQAEKLQRIKQELEEKEFQLHGTEASLKKHKTEFDAEQKLHNRIREQQAEIDRLELLISHTPKIPTAATQESSGKLSFPSFSPLSSLLGSPPAAGKRVRFPTGRRDPLTKIPGINTTIEAILYDSGVTTFEQVARWSSADVRRMADRLGIDRQIIQDEWIAEAQSRLYDRSRTM